MRQRACRAVAMLGAGGALASLALAAAPAGAARPSCAQAAGDFHVALVITHGDRTGHTHCVAFDAGTPTFDPGRRSISGEEVLRLGAARYQAVDFGGGLGRAVCQVDSEPATPPGGFNSGNCFGNPYWVLWRAPPGGAWAGATSGISNQRFADGDAEGLSYGGSPAASPSGLCPPAQPWPTPAATAPPAGGSSVGAVRRPGGPGSAPGGLAIPAGTPTATAVTEATPMPATSPAAGASTPQHGPNGGTTGAGSGPRPGLLAELTTALARIIDAISAALPGWLATVVALALLTMVLRGRPPSRLEHQLNPRALAAWSGAALLVVVLTNNPVYRGVVLLAALSLLVAHRRPGSRLRPVLAFLAMAALLSTSVSLALSHTGVHVLLSVPGGIPVLGGALTLESAVFGVGAGLGIAAAALAMAPLSMVLDAHQLVEALPAPLHRTGTMLAAALNLAPGIGRSAVAVREAQALRGWRPRGPRSYAEILVPVTLTALENSIQLAEAMDARGYGSGPRTRMSPPQWTLTDKVTLAVAIIAAIGIVAGRLAGRVSDWWPYPTLSFPSVNALMVLACALLALPALVRRRD